MKAVAILAMSLLILLGVLALGATIARASEAEDPNNPFVSGGYYGRTYTLTSDDAGNATTGRVEEVGWRAWCIEPDSKHLQGTATGVPLEGSPKNGGGTWTTRDVRRAALGISYIDQALGADKIWDYASRRYTQAWVCCVSDGPDHVGDDGKTSLRSYMDTLLPQRFGLSLSYDEVNDYVSDHMNDPVSTYGIRFAKTDGTQESAQFWTVRNGTLRLVKASALPALTDDNASYSVKDAEYGIYRDEGCAQQVATLALDAHGVSDEATLAPGRYYVRETKAPTGYHEDGTTYAVDVTEDATTLVNGRQGVTDAPLYATGALRIHKHDAETDAALPLGGARLDGAEFTIEYHGTTGAGDAPLRTWVMHTNKEGIADLTDADSLMRGEPYRDDSGACILPLGTYTIRETKAPEGYLMLDEPIQAEVVQDGGTATFRLVGTPTGTATTDVTCVDQVARQDLRFQKVAADSQAPLANVPFLITAQAWPDGGTPESHVIVTDAKGQFDSATFAQGTRDNANDEAVSGLTYSTDDQGNVVADLSQLSLDENRLDGMRGLWFAGDANAPDTEREGLAALPYGSYTVQELPASSNEGYQLVTFTIDVKPDASGHNTAVDLGSITDEEAPHIETEAIATDGGKVIDPLASVTITDTVSYRGLTPGTAYHLDGTLMDASTGAPLADAQGNEVHASTDFTPMEHTGSVDVTFTFDGSSLKQGSRVVVYENLSQDDTEVAAHADIDDEGQSVRVREQPTTPAGILPQTGVTPRGIALIGIGCAVLAVAGARLAHVNTQRTHVAPRRGHRPLMDVRGGRWGER